MGIARECAPPMPPTVCSHCGEPFPTRNQLFRHLSTACDPAAASARSADGVTHRLALQVGYLGGSFQGSSGLVLSAGACDDTSLHAVRSTVEGAVVDAVRRALGDGCVWSVTQAVRTERGASAAANWLVCNLRKPPTGCIDPLVVEMLHLAPQIRLCRPPTLIPSSDSRGCALANINRDVRKLVFAVIIPYSALLSPAEAAAIRARGVRARGLWLTHMPPDCTPADVEAMLRGCARPREGARETMPREASSVGLAAGSPLAAGESWCGLRSASARMPPTGGYAEVQLRPWQAEGSARAGGGEGATCEAESEDSALGCLNGLWWGGRQLVAMRMDEAEDKLLVHRRIRAVLRRMTRGADMRNLVGPKCKETHARNRRVGRCWSAPEGDFRGLGADEHGSGVAGGQVGAGARNVSAPARQADATAGAVDAPTPAALVTAAVARAGGADATSAAAPPCPREVGWLEHDWCVVRFSAPDFASQQVRRMAGVLVAVVRGCESIAYVDQVADGSVRTETPMVPAEAVWLDAVHLKEDAAEALGRPEPTDPELPLPREAAGASDDAYRVLAREMDAGLATRRAEAEALRAAAAAGDVDALEAVLCGLNMPPGESRPERVVPGTADDGRVCGGLPVGGQGSTQAPPEALNRGDGAAAAPRVSRHGFALPRFVPPLGAREPCFQLLLDSRDSYGRSALFLAAASGCAPAVAALLRAGAAAAAAAHGGCTPRDAAEASGFDAVARMLANAEAEQQTTSATGRRGMAAATMGERQRQTASETGEREALPPWRRRAGAEARVAASAHGGWVYDEVAAGSGRQKAGTAPGSQTPRASHCAHRPGEITLLIGGSAPAAGSTSPAEAVLHAGKLSGGPWREAATMGLETHPGAGSVLIEEAVATQDVAALLALHATLPVAPKDKPSPIDRAYFADAHGWLAPLIARAVESALPLLAPGGAAPHAVEKQPSQGDTRSAEGRPGTPDSSAAGGAGLGTSGPVEEGRLRAPMAGWRCTVAPLVRFLHYTSAGGSLPAHVDLCRVLSGGARTSHTFLLYLNDCEVGGETLLLSAREGDAALAPAGGVAPGDRSVLARVRPRRGRLLVTPHACPHLAAATTSPKLVLRGELLLHRESGAAA